MYADHYNKLMQDFENLGFELSEKQKHELKELEPFERVYTVESKSIINNILCRSVFTLIRPKYENYFAIREYQFTKGGKPALSQVFPVTYEQPLQAIGLVDPVTQNKAYALIEGRAVYFERSQQWWLIDLSRKNDGLTQREMQTGTYIRSEYFGNYVMQSFPDFNLSAQLDWLDPKQKEIVENSLRNGDNVLSVKDGQQIYLQVNPSLKYIASQALQSKSLQNGKRAHTHKNKRSGQV